MKLLLCITDIMPVSHQFCVSEKAVLAFFLFVAADIDVLCKHDLTCRRQDSILM